MVHATKWIPAPWNKREQQLRKLKDAKNKRDRKRKNRNQEREAQVDAQMLDAANTWETEADVLNDEAGTMATEASTSSKAEASTSSKAEASASSQVATETSMGVCDKSAAAQDDDGSDTEESSGSRTKCDPYMWGQRKNDRLDGVGVVCQHCWLPLFCCLGL